MNNLIDFSHNHCPERRRTSFRIRSWALFISAWLLITAPLLAQQANIWHIPESTQDGIPGSMRDPATPGAGQSVTFYQGVWKGDGANQTRGWFVYRINGGGWQSVGLGFQSNVGSGNNLNQFWRASLTMPSTIGATVQYYFITDFDNRLRTFVHSGNAVTTNEDTAKANPFSFTVSPPRPVFTVNGTNGDYSKSNFYIDENNDTSSPSLQIRMNPGIAAQVEVFTNLNNRDRANDDFNNDGIEDGILPPDGNLTTTAHIGAYFRAYAMTDSNNDGTYELDLPVLKTGAYRITARYRASPTNPWIWLGSSGIRDHAVVVAPKLLEICGFTNCMWPMPTPPRQASLVGARLKISTIRLNGSILLGCKTSESIGSGFSHSIPRVWMDAKPTQPPTPFMIPEALTPSGTFGKSTHSIPVIMKVP